MPPPHQNNIAWKVAAAMDVIDISPYEGKQCAEIGEVPFEVFKNLFADHNHEEYQSVDAVGGRRRRRASHKSIPSNNNSMEASSSSSSQAIQLFGKAVADDILQATKLIAESGMIYGIGWNQGIIRDRRPLSNLTPNLILLCLQEARFSRRDAMPALTKLISELHVSDAVRQALQEWNHAVELDCTAQLSAAGSKPGTSFVYTTNGLACQRCEIFVARTFCCIQALKWEVKAIPETLWKKIRQCLSIISRGVKSTPSQKTLSKSAALESYVEDVLSRMRKKQQSKSQQQPVQQGKEALPQHCLLQNLTPRDLIVPLSHKEYKKLWSTKLAMALQELDSAMRVEELRDLDHPSAAPPSYRVLFTKPSAHEVLMDALQEIRKDQKTPAPAATVAQAPPVVSLDELEFSHLFSPSDPIIPPDNDHDEWILNATEVELAYLCEESMFSQVAHHGKISWDFVWRFASPALKIILRGQQQQQQQHQHDATDDLVWIAAMIRNDDRLVSNRFRTVRHLVRQELMHGKIRPQLKRTIMQMRFRVRGWPYHNLKIE